MFLLKKRFYCNTVNRETPVVHSVINKQNNKNRLNLHRHSLDGQWFSVLPSEQGGGNGLGLGHGERGVETVTSFLVLACPNTMYLTNVHWESI